VKRPDPRRALLSQREPSMSNMKSLKSISLFKIENIELDKHSGSMLSWWPRNRGRFKKYWKGE